VENGVHLEKTRRCGTFTLAGPLAQLVRRRRLSPGSNRPTISLAGTGYRNGAGPGDYLGQRFFTRYAPHTQVWGSCKSWLLADPSAKPNDT